MRFFHVAISENLNSILKNGLIPGIGVRSALAGEDTPAVYAFKSLEAVEDALMGWLGNELDDESEVSIIEFVDDSNNSISSDSSWEVIFHHAIKPESIKALYDESLNLKWRRRAPDSNVSLQSTRQ